MFPLGVAAGILLGVLLAQSPPFTPTGFLAPQAVSDKDFGNIIVNKVTPVYDGDTFRVNITQWPDLIGQRIGIRVNGGTKPIWTQKDYERYFNE